MAEGAPLLRAYRLTLIEGSNPSLSAMKIKNPVFDRVFYFLATREDLVRTLVRKLR